MLASRASVSSMVEDVFLEKNNRQQLYIEVFLVLLQLFVPRRFSFSPEKRIEPISWG